MLSRPKVTQSLSSNLITNTSSWFKAKTANLHMAVEQMEEATTAKGGSDRYEGKRVFRVFKKTAVLVL